MAKRARGLNAARGMALMVLVAAHYRYPGRAMGKVGMGTCAEGMINRLDNRLL